MTTTISCDESTKERFDTLRPEGAASADEFLSVLLDHYDDRDVGDLSPFGGEVPDLNSQFSCGVDDDRLDRIESSLETVESRTGSIERTLEGLQR